MTENATKAVLTKRRNGRLECEVPAVPDWDGFDKLLQFLQKYYGAKVIHEIDGPDARVRRLEVRDQVLELQHEDPWGNVIVAPSSGAEPVLDEIAADLGQRLAHLAG